MCLFHIHVMNTYHKHDYAGLYRLLGEAQIVEGYKKCHNK
jgi:hypothetical protein